MSVSGECFSESRVDSDCAILTLENSELWAKGKEKKEKGGKGQNEEDK